MKLRDGDQPLPVPNEARDVQSQVIDDIVARRQVGIERYGTALQPHNGRDALRDAYEEAIDLAMYLKQLILERDSGDAETLRRVLLDHHPMQRTKEGPLTGCRCGEVGLGQDVIAHVAAQVVAVLPAPPAACGDLSPGINFGGDSDAERLMCDLPVNHGGAHQHVIAHVAAQVLAALPPSPAEEAVKRVEALCESADGTGRVVFGISDGGAIWARDVRAALASPAPAPQGGGQR